VEQGCSDILPGLREHFESKKTRGMEIVSRNDGLLTNVEVLALLEERRKRRDKHRMLGPELQQRESIELSSIKYLRASAIKETPSEAVIKCLSAIKRLNHDLTEAEMIQIANHAPTLEVEVHMLIEECHERLNEEQIAALIECVQTHFQTEEKADEEAS